MMSPPETRDLARRLLAFESVAGQTSEHTGPAAYRVCEKLRRPLCALAGVAGFRSLLSRALTLAEAEAPGLNAVQVATDGSLLGDLEPQLDNDQGTILIAHLLGLLLTFIGEGLTLRLVQEAWPDAVFDDRNSGSERTG